MPNAPKDGNAEAGILGKLVSVGGAVPIAAELNGSDYALHMHLASKDAGISIGGGTEYTEGDTDASITGGVVMWEDTSDTIVATSAAKPLPVEIIAGAGSGGTAAADDADFTAGTTSGTPIMGVYESTPTNITDGDLGTVGITIDRRLKVSAISVANSGVDIGDVTINNASGGSAVNIQDGGNSITVDGTVALGAGSSSIGILGANSGTDIGDVTINNASGASAVNIQDGGNSITVDKPAVATGGATPYKLVSAATTNATTVKASAGTVYMITASNVNAAVRYLKLYNKASSPTVGTDTPVHTFAIPGNTAGAGTNIPVPDVGIEFSAGISFALTTEATDAGTTAVAANEIVVNLAYK